MPVSTRQRLMRERARALAIIRLTERADVQVDDVHEDIGIDLLVRTTPRGRSGLRQLGVELRYVMEPVTAPAADRVLTPTLRAHAADYGPFPFPVVMLLFTMRDDGAWYTWVAEPVVPESGTEQLVVRDSPACAELDAGAVRELLRRVDDWYDLRYSVTAAR